MKSQAKMKNCESAARLNKRLRPKREQSKLRKREIESSISQKNK